MTDEKICPVISKPYLVDSNPPHQVNVHVELMKVKCLKEECEFWVSDCDLYSGGFDCGPENCEERDREYRECKGGCRLI